jgi:hypothetical protein
VVLIRLSLGGSFNCDFHPSSGSEFLQQTNLDIISPNLVVNSSCLNLCSEKNLENAFSPRKWLSRRTNVMIQLESVPEELSSEWSCQYVSRILIEGVHARIQ